METESPSSVVTVLSEITVRSDERVVPVSTLDPSMRLVVVCAEAERVLDSRPGLVGDTALLSSLV